MDSVVWKCADSTVKLPCLSDAEKQQVKKFVCNVPPIGDACPKIFNLLIRFARETIDAEEKSKKESE